jgi:hypothetical protein
MGSHTQSNFLRQKFFQNFCYYSLTNKFYILTEQQVNKTESQTSRVKPSYEQIQFNPPHIVTLRSTFMLSSHHYLHFPGGFATEILYVYLRPHSSHKPSPS